MSTSTTTSTATTIKTTKVPKRYIYNESDIKKFRNSPIKKEFLQFINALGRSCYLASGSSNNNNYNYEPNNPLIGLSPGFASLHGSLNAISTLWLKEIPPCTDAKARFGNPSFKIWYNERLIERSYNIVNCILQCSEEYSNLSFEDITMDILEECSKKGYACAATDIDIAVKEDDRKNNAIITELCAYLHSSFGHPIRLDYGTGHECSFLVFLFSLFKIKCLDNNDNDNDNGNNSEEESNNNKESQCVRFAATAISIMHQYLEITRGLQDEYMLEPAGSHGVWGLDDYYCLSFYFGACQLINNTNEYTPNTIHDNATLQQESKRYLYFGCINFIKQIKKGVPFFESSPMLNDISSLPTWNKVSIGLLLLYEGEVLDKLPVVQHFVFGDIFKATWTPSSLNDSLSYQVGSTSTGIGVRTSDNNLDSVMPPTRAPWAK